MTEPIKCYDINTVLLAMLLVLCATCFCVQFYFISALMKAERVLTVNEFQQPICFDSAKEESKKVSKP